MIYSLIFLTIYRSLAPQRKWRHRDGNLKFRTGVANGLHNMPLRQLAKLCQRSRVGRKQLLIGLTGNRDKLAVADTALSDYPSRECFDF